MRGAPAAERDVAWVQVAGARQGDGCGLSVQAPLREVDVVGLELGFYSLGELSQLSRMVYAVVHNDWCSDLMYPRLGYQNLFRVSTRAVPGYYFT